MAATTTGNAVEQLFSHPSYLLRRKVLKLFGGAFHVYAPDGQVVFYSKLAAFKLKEDIRLYTGEDMQHEVLSIQARQVIDFSASYDVFDSVGRYKVGALRRRGFKSIIKDEWMILDANDVQVGTVKEDNVALALVRRFLTNLIPQSYSVDVGGQGVAEFKQAFNPFVYKLNIDFTLDRQGYLDRRLGIAAAVLLGAVEGRQQ